MNGAGEAAPFFVHATALLVGEAGVLLRGAPGSGKTSLALRLVDEALRDGRFAALVADDRVSLAARGGRLVARPHPAIEGLAERRGLGVVRVPHEPACVVKIVVDLVPPDTAAPPDRMPGAATLRTGVAGVVLPRIRVAASWAAFDACGTILSHAALQPAG